MNERLPGPIHEFPRSSDPSNKTDNFDDLNTDKESFAEADEKVYIEPRVDGDEWILAQEAFFERFPHAEVPTERALVDQLADGRLTVDAFRKNFIDAEIQYETLSALLRGAPKGEVALTLPSIDEYMALSQDERNQQQSALDYGLVKNQYSTWLRQISGRFSTLTELMLAYKHVADAEVIALDESDEDNLKKAA